jgi:predicted dinucleotide-binding enzyme
MMTIGIIGAGEMGTCLAIKLIRQGYTVSLANSRGPASIKQIAEEIGADARTVAETISTKQVIIIAIPEKNISLLPKHLFKDLSGDVVVIETGNFYPSLRDGAIPALEQHGTDSLWVQEQLGVPVVKVFNSILATSLQKLGRPRGEKDRIALAVSGDDVAAKKVVLKLVDELGFDPCDIGPIAESWRQQPGSPIYCRDLNLEELKRRFDSMKTAGRDLQNEIITKRKADEALMASDYPAYLKNLKD